MDGRELDNFLLIPLGVGAIWDAVTTVYGSIQVLGHDPKQLAASIAFAVTIAAILIRTRSIFQSEQHIVVKIFFQICWFVAIIYDVGTSYYGTTHFIVTNAKGPEQYAVIVGLTLLTSASTVLISFLLPNRDA